MKVLLFHPTLLPPKDYGGVERVVLWLSRGLIERGHEVWVAAYPGSKLPLGVKLLETSEENSAPGNLAARLPKGMDVVHFMAPPSAEVIQGFPLPCLTTVHGNGKSGEVFPLNTVFLSQDHARRHGSSQFVYNGLDPNEFVFNPLPRSKAKPLFLSKTSWKVKNLRGAIRICERAGVGLSVAGGARPYGLRFKSCVKKYLGMMGLSQPDVTWEGAVSGLKKAELLSKARCLVFPVLWPEPFGLVVAEALFSGTPVLASALGSMPELLGGLGTLLPPPVDFESEQLWVEKLRAEPSGDFEACRAWAMQKFHYQIMAENYERLYRKVALGDCLQQIAPRTQSLGRG